MSITIVFTAFLVSVAILVIGLPVAAVLAGIGVAGGLASLGPRFVDSMGSVIWGVQNENLLTAIPLFVLLGEMLLRSGIADRMYVACRSGCPAAGRAAAHQHRRLRAVRGDFRLVGRDRCDDRHGRAARRSSSGATTGRARSARWRPGERSAS